MSTGDPEMTRQMLDENILDTYGLRDLPTNRRTTHYNPEIEKATRLMEADEELRKFQAQVAESAQIFAKIFQTMGLTGTVRLNSGSIYGVCHVHGSDFHRVVIRYEKSEEPLIARGRVYQGGELLLTYDFCSQCERIYGVRLNRQVFPKDLDFQMDVPFEQGTLQMSDESV